MKLYPWTEDEMLRSEAKEAKPKISYPADHQVGMRVPQGGSDCAKCKYVRQDGAACANQHFIAWNGSKFLPAPADKYCCDFFETA
jgi:hypothetical protein